LAELDPGLAKMREATVTMVATLGSFGTAVAIKDEAQLSTSVVILAVALALTMGRHGQRADGHIHRRGPLAIVVVPLVAVGANEIGTLLFQHADLGDTLFVLAVSATIWARRLGPAARRIATLATFPLVAMLIVPGPIIEVNASGADTRWWSAVIALSALAWVNGTRALALRGGFLVVAASPGAPATNADSPTAGPARTAAGAHGPNGPGKPKGTSAGSVRKMAASDKMAIQMAAALGAAFVVGRGLFGMHWTWVVVTAFIVSSGNRGRGDVVYKAAMRLVGACTGTLAATALTGVFAPGDAWAIVVIFAVLAVALWLRSFSYAYWAGGMTAALALLYGYYGEGGIGLLGDRLEGILAGAALAVAAAWLLWPVRTTDVLRRDTALALAALDRYIASLAEDLGAVNSSQHEFQRAAAALAQTGTPLRAVPTRLRSHFPYLPAVKALERCARELPSVTGVVATHGPGSHGREHLQGLRGGIAEMRRANGQRLPPDPPAWERLVDRVRELATDPAAHTPGAPANPPQNQPAAPPTGSPR
jgi:hypothetical protein